VAAPYGILTYEEKKTSPSTSPWTKACCQVGPQVPCLLVVRSAEVIWPAYEAVKGSSSRLKNKSVMFAIHRKDGKQLHWSNAEFVHDR